MSEEIKICAKGTDLGLVFPGTEWEHDIPQVIRVLIYGFGLLYFFMGIAVIADVFMEAIEAVTSARTTKISKDGRRRTGKVWNETVATLSLMALGSSAPEIFLSVIDVIKGKFYFGSSIGASTIVGSAAFNLFVIVAVCIMIIPLGEERLIRNMPAFYVTAVFSMGAYMWMGFILLYSSPNIVDVWEALVTFLLLPVLLIVSYKVDQGDLDGILRALRIISAYDEVIAAEQPKRRLTIARKRVRPSIEHVASSGTYTIVWHSRNAGWSAERSDSLEDAQAIFARIPRALSRAIFDPEGEEVQSWYINSDWGLIVRSYFNSLKRGHYVKFAQECMHVQGTEEVQQLEVRVTRKGGLSERLTCDYHTEAMSAVVGFDFEKAEGSIEFGEGEYEKVIELTILGRPRWRGPATFLLVLDPGDEEDVKFDPLDDGGTQCAILTLIIDPLAEHESASGFAKRVESVVNCAMLVQGCKDWGDRFKSIGVVELDDDDEEAQAGWKDYGLHVFYLPWKIVSSLLPPTTLFGGWLTFWMTLIYLGLITACVSDLAELFGCVIEAPSIVTAITFVALGTSMPDLFASISAAKEDPTADASVVNVTGSNSVNVFLGLGVPWSMAAIYWQATPHDSLWASRYPALAAVRGGQTAFVVESSNLGQSVVVYSASSSAALVLLHLRRKWVGAELGGPKASKFAISVTFVLYWLIFVGLVSWRVMRWGDPGYTMQEQGAVYLCAVLVGATATATTIVLMRREREGAFEEDDDCAHFGSRRTSEASVSASADGPVILDLSGRLTSPEGSTVVDNERAFNESITSDGWNRSGNSSRRSSKSDSDFVTEGYDGPQAPRESCSKRSTTGGYDRSGSYPVITEFGEDGSMRCGGGMICTST